MRPDVERRFNKAVKERLKSKPDVCKFILNHERKGICIDNICTQIRMAELGQHVFNAAKYDKVITEVAKMFAKTALDHKHEELLPDAIKAQMVNKANLVKEIEAEITEIKDGQEKSIS